MKGKTVTYKCNQRKAGTCLCCVLTLIPTEIKEPDNCPLGLYDTPIKWELIKEAEEDDIRG